jgi:citrate synthase
MEKILSKLNRLIMLHDQISPEVIKEKNVKLGLRNADGTGVVVGITTKGRVIGYDLVENDKGEKKVRPVEGRLYYCGYDVSEIVKSNEEHKRLGFEEVVYLLITGELPDKSDYKKFAGELRKRAKLTNMERRIIIEEVENTNQMYALHSVISHLSRCDKNPDARDMIEVSNQCINLIAKAPIIVAHNYNVYRYRRGEDLRLVRPRETLSLAENFLYMLRGEVPDKEDALILDACMIMHAEHGGGNNSTFTVRTVSSSGANTYMAIAAGVASLSGQFHGGANESVMAMMKACRKEVKDWSSEKQIRKFLEDILDGKNVYGSGKIFGMGHAVYTLSDPRAIILKEYARRLAEKNNSMDLFNLFDSVERAAKKLLIERKGKEVCVNVDFYSGLVYKFLGIPEIIYTPIFAMSRIVGWSAHRLEQIIQGKIIRPAYISPNYEMFQYRDINHR